MLWVLLGTASMVPTVCAQTPSPAQTPTPAPAADAAKKADDSAKKDEPIVAITGGTIITVTRETITNGTLLIQGSKILDVGQDLEIPANAKKIDATGRYVVPGFLSMQMSRVALAGNLGSPTSRPNDSVDPFDQNMKFCLAAGITGGSVDVSGRGGRFFFSADGELIDLDADQDPKRTSVCPCCGLTILSTEPITPVVPAPPTARKDIVVKFAYGDVKNIVVKEAPYFHIPTSGLSGSVNRKQFRDNLVKAKQYIAEQAKHEEDVKAGKQTPPPAQTVSADYVKLIKKEISLRTDPDSVSAIRELVALAKEFDLKLTLDNVTEGWLCAEELGKPRFLASSRREINAAHDPVVKPTPAARSNWRASLNDQALSSRPTH